MENRLYLKYFGYIASSLFMTVIGTMFGTLFSDMLMGMGLIPLLIISLGVMFGFLFAKGTLKKILFYVFTFIEGITLTPIIMMYSTVSVTLCLVLTFVIVIVFGLIGYFYKGRMDKLGRLLFIALMFLVLYSILSIFFNLPSVAVISVVVFSLYVMYDMNEFKQEVLGKNKIHSLAKENHVTEDEYVLIHAMSMYLNIINIFIDLLSILGDAD